MRTLRRLAVDPIDAQESTRITVTLLGIYGLVVGVIGLFGAPSRFNTPTYREILGVPGGVMLWAFLITTNSLVLIYCASRGCKKATAVTLFLGAIWTFAVAAGFFLAYLGSENVSALSYTSLGLIAVLHCQKGWLMWSNRNVDLIYISQLGRPADDE